MIAPGPGISLMAVLRRVQDVHQFPRAHMMEPDARLTGVCCKLAMKIHTRAA